MATRGYSEIARYLLHYPYVWSAKKDQKQGFITDSYPNDTTSTYDGVAELQTFKPLPGATSACLQCFLASRKCTLRRMGLSFVPAVCGCPGSL